MAGSLNRTARCFACRKIVRPAVVGATGWACPSGGVRFEGGSSFGSSLYDTLVDGKLASIVVCDKCLAARKRLVLEIQGEPGWK